jgi:hypothetical protein
MVDMVKVTVSSLASLRRYRGTLERPPLKDDRRRLGRLAVPESDQVLQVIRVRRERIGIDPAPGLLRDCVPGRQIARHDAP